MSTLKQDEIFHAILLKAFNDGEVFLACGDESAARAMRFRIYAFERKAKAQFKKDGIERELHDAIEGLSLQAEGDTLRIFRKELTKGMSVLLEALGGEDAARGLLNKSLTEGEMGASMRRFLEKMGGEGQVEIAPAEPSKPSEPAPRSTPYYTREK